MRTNWREFAPDGRRPPGWSPIVLAVVLLLAGCTGIGAEPVATAPADAPAPDHPPPAGLEQLLSSVRVVAARPRPGGYERGCGPGRGCVFGWPWTDDNNGPGGHDGCGTRDNVLAGQLTEVVFRPGARDCVVVSGRLDDPYTGELRTFRRAEAGEVQIDHVYPLAAAWDLGASRWTPEQRVIFANDVETNLLATGTDVNQDKGDATPARWLPPAPARRCFYAAKYLLVAVRYDLPVTTADDAVLREVARNCR